ncbi:4'-phosphopantetheinyl transferase superfamily protein [Ferruginibacter lapsinanis]|uniref:4'-phosphopantetheinyl transferase family protein n=1 Tax=Ferruginibacter lapsinanis TaxID=563172 RepID=UPI001E339B9D|nr:4'-phosphopantetheinyl transferase superfamily protein [Ferruginibacter lapsinanis]UEG49919.1 4'-phosphopantetheinyl transferase superfamily protein [Ferruginibacter lapsinanis]
MPLVYQQNINEATKIGIWHIAEAEEYFLREVPVQREITHPHKRLQHLAGRVILKELYPDFPYSLIRIADTRKPFLEDEAYHFSISHCGDYAAAIVSNKNRVGVDIELVTKKTEKVKHKFLSNTEQEYLSAIFNHQHSKENDQSLTAAWSIKETLFKWQGVGEVDFIKHLQIGDITRLSEENYKAACLLKVSSEIKLDVFFKFFNDAVLSWCVK